MRETGKPVSEVARDIDVTETSLYAWVRQDRIGRGDGAPGALTTEQLEELRSLRKEVRDLRMERDLFKKNGGVPREREEVKFAALVAQRIEFKVSWMCRRRTEILNAARALAPR